MMMRRLLTTTAATSADSSSFAQRIRDLPKDLPGTNIKKHVSQVHKHVFSLQDNNIVLCFLIGDCDAVTVLHWLSVSSVPLYHATCMAKIFLYPTSLPKIQDFFFVQILVDLNDYIIILFWQNLEVILYPILLMFCCMLC